MFEEFTKYKKWNVYSWFLYLKVLIKMLFSHHLIRIYCPVYDAEEIKKQEQQEAIKKLYPLKKGR